jgi:hypothetical protein
MNSKTLILISCLAPLFAAAGGCLQSEGEEALQQIDHQEKAWEAKDPSAGDLSAQGLIDMYAAVAKKYPDLADTANDRITRVGNWQALGARAVASSP